MKPYIVFTLQRTGGTNFFNRMSKTTNFKVAPEHEPFVKTRCYGDITKRFLKDKDKETLGERLAEVLSDKTVIKHCVENTPLELSKELVKQAKQHGYRLLFLYRENVLGRLLSMEYAKRTDIWGPKTAQERSDFDDSVAFEHPLDVDFLISHENRCRERLLAMYEHAKKLSIPAKPIRFESIYKSSEEDGSKCVEEMLSFLGDETDSEETRKFYKALTEKGEQGTKRKYSNFTNYDELKKAVEKLPVYNF